jgi:hypothetical protein
MNTIFSVLPPKLNSLKNTLCGEYLNLANPLISIKTSINTAVILNTVLNIFSLLKNIETINGVKSIKIKYINGITILPLKIAGA